MRLGQKQDERQVPAHAASGLPSGRGAAYFQIARTVDYPEGIKVIRTPVQAPNPNAHAERWVRTIRTDCLDRILILGRRPEWAGLQAKPNFRHPWGAQTQPRDESGRFAGGSNKCTPRGQPAVHDTPPSRLRPTGSHSCHSAREVRDAKRVLRGKPLEAQRSTSTTASSSDRLVQA
jgi:hypothetical protein